MASELIAVVGPTASGKTALSLRLAEAFDGEIVNYDSVQLVRGFDIGSAKVRPEEMRRIPHHLIDVVDPGPAFSAGDYARLARDCARQIASRGKTPIFTGGTGFYLRATIEGLFRGPGRDNELRARLEQRQAERGRAYLHRVLRRIDAAAAREIHENDAPKVIRAIEVRLRGGAPVGEQWAEGAEPLAGFAVRKIGLDPPREALRARISRRAEAMFDEGLVDEVEGLLAAGVPRDAWALRALGYAQAMRVLAGELSREEAMAETALRTGQYAKRQITWFRREPDVTWLAGFGGDPAIQARAVDAIRAARPD